MNAVAKSEKKSHKTCLFFCRKMIYLKINNRWPYQIFYNTACINFLEINA